MSRKATYYLGRVVKIGALLTADIISALKSPVSITRFGSAWTFVDVDEYEHKNSVYVFGRLVKYDPDGEVLIIDPDLRKEVRQREPNMTLASSVFVYVPEYSGISFLHVSSTT